MAEASPAVFKTVCGALLRRPGWVQFPSIPATFHAMAAPKPKVSADQLAQRSRAMRPASSTALLTRLVVVDELASIVA